MIEVDQSIIISLHENVARQKNTLQEVAKLNLKTDFYLSQLDKDNGERGCFNAHVSVAKNALQQDCQSLLVFEDDVKILPFSQHQITAINHFIKSNKQFDLLYLGFILGKIWFCGSTSIVRAKGAGLHAYVLSRKGIEKMANCRYEDKPVDEVVEKNFRAYSVYPMFAVQHPETATNSSLTVFRNRRKKYQLKNHSFWLENTKKQKRRLWSNLHRTIYDLFRYISYKLKFKAG